MDGQWDVTTIRQKTREDKVAWAARLASTWLLEKVKERRFVKGQTYEETCRASGKWNVNEQKGGDARASNSETNKRVETDRNFTERRVGDERRPNFRLLPVFRKASAARCDHACGVVQRRQESMR
ncbi:hypothetical protein EI94DRAFT_303701 [Lactarius quietus]|nr:hypothetical protein EI94DRAFT_303701 [Lactarius quietus]